MASFPAAGSGFPHHALAVPVAAQGHMNPLMRLCKTLAHHHGFTITFVTVGPLKERMEDRAGESGGDTSAPAAGRIRMTSIPVPETPAEAKTGFRFTLSDFVRSVDAALDGALEGLIHALSEKGPPVTCIISDISVSTSTQRVADKLNLPRVVFVSSSQAFNLLVAHMSSGAFPVDEAIRAGQQRDQRPLQPISAELPGLPSLVYRDAYFCKHLHDETEEVVHLLCENVRIALANARGLNTVAVNSFLELEAPAFEAHRHLPVYPIGPLLEDLSSDEATNTSLWKEDDACLSWLDTRPPRSVLFISFGSMTLLSKAHFQEFLLGLEASSQSFLLVFRPDLISDPSYAWLPEEFLARTRGLGYAVRWAPQLRVLSHPAVGGFLTHCGWNSVIEAIANGVPMLCWPYFADQPLDAKYIVDEWKIGLRVEPLVAAGIEGVIRTLMQSARGEALRENALRLSSIAKGCHLPTGSSYQNIQAIVKTLLPTTTVPCDSA